MTDQDVGASAAVGRRLRPGVWLLVLLGVAAVGGLAAGMFWMQGRGTAASRLGFAVGVLEMLWLAWGMWQWRQVGWVSRVSLVVEGTVAAGLVVWLMVLAGRPGAAIGVTGVWAMATGFLVGLWGVRALLSYGSGIWAVARTLIDEAVRMKIALIFIVLLLLLVPILPFLLDPKELLQYREQFFLNWSLAGTSLMLSLMTIFLACRTVSGDLAQRQIFLTMSKPISRLRYLMGKWLGICLLNMLLLVIAGAGIYTFARVLEHSGTQQNDDDMQAVDQQVLTARVAAAPRAPLNTDLGAMYEQRLQQLRADFPGDYDQVTPAQEQAIRSAVIASWYTVGPRRVRSYQFTGLAAARELGEWLQLRLKPNASQRPADGRVELAIRVGGQLDRVVRLPAGVPSVVTIHTAWITPEGELLVEIGNPDSDVQPRVGSISFSPDHGIEVLYRADSFEANLSRSMAILWVRLVFLAMLGLTAATVLDFPVAALVCLIVYVTAATSGFFDEALASFVRLPHQDLSWWERVTGTLMLFWENMRQGNVWAGMKIPIRLVGQFFMMLMPSLSRYSPGPLMSEGRMVPWGLVGQSFFWVGVVWTGVCGLVGWALFSRRELARVTV